MELLRIENISIGRYDDKNIYTAEIKIAGEEAKNAGEEVLRNMTYHPTLQEALQRAATRTKRSQSAKTITEYIEALHDASELIKCAAKTAAQTLNQ